MGEVRRKQSEEVVVLGERVRLEYMKGKKTYFDDCPGGVARTIGSRSLCCKTLVIDYPGNRLQLTLQ